ncbi:MAG TPA: PQQ-binding-like beta-propeller repeat protein [Myxococcota bacterium]|nr:PQQ-binding-like beta-propeller repeat protein [Myxococcota bacterium]
MQHHSALDGIDRTSVARLGLAWATDMPTLDGMVGNPLVKNGVIFQSGALGRIYANDVRTGKLLWSFEPEHDFTGRSFVGYWGSRINRGVALWNDLVIASAGDCRLNAVEQMTGKLRWVAQPCDSEDAYAITAAPRVGGDLIFTGNACGDSGATRGYVDALDARTGERRWRFYTVPGDPARPQDSDLHEMTARTWGTGWYSKTKGCGSVWDAITYDPVLKQLYIGVGGPAPMNPAQRAPDAGDELFTSSVVALNAETGEYRWHFKQVPNDGWNYDASVGLMVAELPLGGTPRRVVISVPKNGFAYVLDAASGEFVSGGAYTAMNWAKGLDAKGRPVFDPAARYWQQGRGRTVVLPSPIGAHGWEAIAFSPAERLVYIPTMVIPAAIESRPESRVEVDYYYGSSGDSAWNAYGELVAWDPLSGSVRWRRRHPLPVNGGLLHTAGGLVFQGTASGELEALDAATGALLWSRPVGGSIRAAPSTVLAEGEQLILVATGSGSSAATASWLSKYSSAGRRWTQARLLAFKLDGTAAIPEDGSLTLVPEPSEPRMERALVARGRVLFEANECHACHGLSGDAVHGAIPNLLTAPPPSFEAFQSIVQDGALAVRGMPQFPLADEDVRALYAFVIESGWNAYEAQRGSEER